MLRKGGAFRGTWHDLQAVDGLSLDLKRGETLGLVGESGSGKTTFGQALMRLNKLNEGEIEFLGNRIDGAGPQRDEALSPAHADRVPGPVQPASTPACRCARSSRKG